MRIRLAIRVDKEENKIYIFTGRKSMKSFMKDRKGIYMFYVYNVDDFDEFIKQLTKKYDIEYVGYTKRVKGIKEESE